MTTSFASPVHIFRRAPRVNTRPAAAALWKILPLLLLAPLAAPASFHLWRINEVFSNDDGTVQFIEFTCANNSQEFITSHIVRCIGPQATNSFTFASDLPTGTLNKTFIMATAAYTNQPGAVPPDYLIPNNFLPLNGGSVNFGLNQHILNYTNLPTDGVRSLTRVTNAGVTNLSLVLTNSPRNFAAAQGSVVPLRILSLAGVSNALVASYPTATGKAYVIERRDSLAVTNWTPLATNAGTGGVLSFTNAFSNLTQRALRVRAQ